MEFIILALIAVVLVLPYMYMRYSAQRCVGRPAPQLDDLVPAGADLSRPLYFYFMSDRCSMCRIMTPQVSELQQDDPNIMIINIGEHPQLATQFGVQGTPTTMAVSAGVIEKVKLGALKGEKLKAFLGHP